MDKEKVWFHSVTGCILNIFNYFFVMYNKVMFYEWWCLLDVFRRLKSSMHSIKYLSI